MGGPNNEDCKGSTLGYLYLGKLLFDPGQHAVSNALKIVMARRKATHEIHSSALHRSKEEVPGSQHT